MNKKPVDVMVFSQLPTRRFRKGSDNRIKHEQNDESKMKCCICIVEYEEGD